MINTLFYVHYAKMYQEIDCRGTILWPVIVLGSMAVYILLMTLNLPVVAAMVDSDYCSSDKDTIDGIIAVNSVLTVTTYTLSLMFMFVSCQLFRRGILRLQILSSAPMVELEET